MKIAVIGAAGSVGSPAAFYLAAQGLAEEILMIGGKRQNVLKQHAMDISTAVSALDVKVYAGDYSDLGGTDLVINTAGVEQGLIKDRMEMLPKNIPLIQKIANHIQRYCPEAIVITATNPIDPLNYAAYKVGNFNRKKMIGYSINDSYRFRELLAVELGVKVSEVDAIVIGEHGSTQVPLFSSVRVNGDKVTIETETKQRILNEIPKILRRYEELKSGRTAGWTCAIGLAEIIRAIRNNNGSVIPCSVVLEGEYGQKDISMSVPVILGQSGLQEILEYDLAPDEQERFKSTVETLKSAVNLVNENLN